MRRKLSVLWNPPLPSLPKLLRQHRRWIPPAIKTSTPWLQILTTIQDEYPLATDPDGHRDESPLVTDTPHESSEENDTEGPDQTYNLCPKCSELLLQGATECHFCGHKLASHAGERSQDADSPEDPTANIHPAWNRVRSGLQLCCYAGLLHGLAFGLLALLCLVVVLPIWLQVLSLVAAFVLVVILFASDSVGDQVPLRFAFVPLGYFVMLIIAPPHVAAVFWTLGLLVAVIASWAGTGAFVAGQAISTAAPDPGARACAGGALASSVISVLCSIVLVLRVFVAEEDTTQVIQSLDYDPVQFGLVLLNSIFMPLAILLFAFFCRAVAVFMNDMEAQREVNAFLVSLCVTFIAYVFMVALVFVLNAVRSMGLALAILLALPMIAMAVTSVFVLLYRFLQLISATQNAIDQCQ